VWVNINGSNFPTAWTLGQQEKWCKDPIYLVLIRHIWRFLQQPIFKRFHPTD
jgi:hypothetical protein